MTGRAIFGRGILHKRMQNAPVRRRHLIGPGMFDRRTLKRRRTPHAIIGEARQQRKPCSCTKDIRSTAAPHQLDSAFRCPRHLSGSMIRGESRNTRSMCECSSLLYRNSAPIKGIFDNHGTPVTPFERLSVL